MQKCLSPLHVQAELLGGELALGDLEVRGAGAQQLLVGPAADHVPLVEYEDLVGVHDRGDALAHHHDRGVRDRAGELGAQPSVRGVVERGEGVVKDDDLRPLGEGARYGEALALPAGDVGAALGDGRVVSLGALLDEPLANLRFVATVPEKSRPCCGT